MSYNLSIKKQASFESIVDRVQDLLHQHGYLIAADIDVQNALRTMLDVDMPKTKIIGTNKPEVGHEIFSTDPKMGTLLPFSIVVNESDKDEVEVTTIDPEWLFRHTDKVNIMAHATEVKQVFKEILEKL